MASSTPSNCYAAVDIGASSGRVVIGTVNEGQIELTEIHRFDNIQKRINGHDCWDIDMLFRERRKASPQRLSASIPGALTLFCWTKTTT